MIRNMALYFLLMVSVNCFAQDTSAPAHSQPKPAPASPGQGIKDLKSKMADIEKKLGEVTVQVDSATKIVEGYQQVQDNVEESNLAITELNRKLNILEQKFEQYRAEAKLKEVNEQDTQKSGKVRETMNEKSATQNLDDRVNILDTEIVLLKNELSRIQEKIGISEAAKAEQAQKEESEEEENMLQKIQKAPWVPLAALGISVIAFLVAVF